MAVYDQFGRQLNKKDRIAFCTLECKKIVWKRGTIVDIYKDSVRILTDGSSREATTCNTQNMILLDRVLDKPA